MTSRSLYLLHNGLKFNKLQSIAVAFIGMHTNIHSHGRFDVRLASLCIAISQFTVRFTANVFPHVFSSTSTNINTPVPNAIMLNKQIKRFAIVFLIFVSFPNNLCCFVFDLWSWLGLVGILFDCAPSSRCAVLQCVVQCIS